MNCQRCNDTKVIKEHCLYDDNFLCAANEGGIGDCYNPDFGTDDFTGCDWFKPCPDCNKP